MLKKNTQLKTRNYTVANLCELFIMLTKLSVFFNPYTSTNIQALTVRFLTYIPSAYSYSNLII